MRKSILASSPALALLVAVTASAAQPDAKPPASWIIGGFQSPDAWQFLMGPDGAPEQSLKLVKKGDGAFVGFVCKSDGTERIGLTYRSEGAPVEKDFKVSVDATGNLLHMKPDGQPDKDGQVTYSATGPAVVGILAAMGAVGEQRGGALSFDDGKERPLVFDLPEPRNLASTSANVCRGWTSKISGAEKGTPN